MPLTVEDGTGLATADSYGTVDGFFTYVEERYESLNTDEELVEAALRRATTYIDTMFRDRFRGYRTRGRIQRLEWPREFTGWLRGVPITQRNEVPYEVISATYEAAYREVLEPRSLMRDITPSQMVVREKVGPLETEYAAASASSAQVVVPIIEKILSPVLNGMGGMTVFAQRA